MLRPTSDCPLVSRSVAHTKNVDTYLCFSPQTHIVSNVEELDPDVLNNLTSLGCFKDKERLLRELLTPK